MITPDSIWNLLTTYAPRNRWVSSKELYELIECHGRLGSDDRLPYVTGTRVPRWRYLVREVLVNHTRSGALRTRNRHTGLPA